MNLFPINQLNLYGLHRNLNELVPSPHPEAYCQHKSRSHAESPQEWASRC